MKEMVDILEIDTEEKPKLKVNYFFKIFIIIFISSFYVELIFRYLSFKSLYDVEVIRIMLFTVATSLLISFVASLYREKIAKILVFLFSFITGLYAILQLNFYS